MKIVYVLRTGYGVAGEAASFHYASIMAKNHEVLVLANEPPDYSELSVSTDANIKILNIYAPTIYGQVINIYKNIQHFQPDLIHLIQSPYCFHYIFYLKHLTPSSKWLIDFRSPHVGDKKSVAIKRYFWLQFYVDRVLTHSMSSLKTNLPLKLVKAYEVPPGIDLSSFKVNETKLQKNKLNRFVFIGSINKRRKIEFLILTFIDFAKGRNLNISLDIYGYGNDYTNIKKLIQEKDIEKLITLKGALPQKELFKIIPEYDVGIAYVPYKFFNTAPSLKALEYAASKIPIIASDTLGHKEYNKIHGFNFKLFKNTAENFKTILEDVIQHGFSNDHIVKNFKAIEHFDWKYIVEKKLQNIYKNLLNQ